MAGRFLIIFIDQSNFLAPIISIIHKPFLWYIINFSTFFWGTFYSNILSTQDFILIINNIEVIQLMPGCDGLYPILRMTFILILYPLPWRTKLWLLPLSWLIILFAATIHFLQLIPVAYQWPEYYTFSHNWISRFIFYLFYFLTWILWEKVGYPKKRWDIQDFRTIGSNKVCEWGVREQTL